MNRQSAITAAAALASLVAGVLLGPLVPWPRSGPPPEPAPKKAAQGGPPAQRDEGRRAGEDPLGVVRVQPYLLPLSTGQRTLLVPNPARDAHPAEVVHLYVTDIDGVVVDPALLELDEVDVAATPAP